jgi:hypothetical protein
LRQGLDQSFVPIDIAIRKKRMEVFDGDPKFRGSEKTGVFSGKGGRGGRLLSKDSAEGKKRDSGGEELGQERLAGGRPDH